MDPQIEIKPAQPANGTFLRSGREYPQTRPTPPTVRDDFVYRA